MFHDPTPSRHLFITWAVATWTGPAEPMPLVRPRVAEAPNRYFLNDNDTIVTGKFPVCKAACRLGADAAEDSLQRCMALEGVPRCDRWPLGKAKQGILFTPKRCHSR